MGTIAVCGFTELPTDLTPKSLRLPVGAIALDDPLGALERMALGCIITNADGYIRMEGADRNSTRCL
ncbi:hypothetical protein XH80_12020 [Bradyrhizobium sp. CCBAU 45384]|nr:hypothetical protein [Bradyrhizobium sp. CCBAU 45384]